MRTDKNNKKRDEDYENILLQIKQVERKIVSDIRNDAEQMDRENTSLPNLD